jgi:hypothetical protein
VISLPNLPPGWTAQPFYHVDVGDTCYESHRVYDASERLHPDQSFWLVTPQDAGDRPEMRMLTYAEYREAGGRMSYREFESETGSQLVWHLVPRSSEIT